MTSTGGAITASRADVVAAATALVNDAPKEIPASFPVGGQLVGATQLLGLFASAVRGDDPCQSRELDVPDRTRAGSDGARPPLSKRA